jgi:uncharacterized protein (TIGR02145 family)
MKQIILKNCLLGAIIILGISCSSNSIEDKDGNVYETTKIANQIWLTKNLTTCTFRNGDEIVQSTTSSQWAENIEDKVPSWCYYEFNDENGTTYGKIYNYYAVIDSRGLAPEGFRIANHEDWKELENFLECKNCDDPFPKLIPTGNAIWGQQDDDENIIGTNETGFSALPGGHVFIDYDKASFTGLGDETGWWSISTGHPNSIHPNWNEIRNIGLRSHHGLNGLNESNNVGLYVRCLK